MLSPPNHWRKSANSSQGSSRRLRRSMSHPWTNCWSEQVLLLSSRDWKRSLLSWETRFKLIVMMYSFTSLISQNLSWSSKESTHLSSTRNLSTNTKRRSKLCWASSRVILLPSPASSSGASHLQTTPRKYWRWRRIRTQLMSWRASLTTTPTDSSPCSASVT